jgi:hypothetical protein
VRSSISENTAPGVDAVLRLKFNVEPAKKSSTMNSPEVVALSDEIHDLQFDEDFSCFLAQLQSPSGNEVEGPIEEFESQHATEICDKCREFVERRSDAAVDQRAVAVEQQEVESFKQRRQRDRNRINQARYRDRKRVRKLNRLQCSYAVEIFYLPLAFFMFKCTGPYIADKSPR